VTNCDKLRTKLVIGLQGTCGGGKRYLKNFLRRSAALSEAAFETRNAESVVNVPQGFDSGDKIANILVALRQLPKRFRGYLATLRIL